MESCDDFDRLGIDSLFSTEISTKHKIAHLGLVILFYSEWLNGDRLSATSHYELYLGMCHEKDAMYGTFNWIRVFVE